MKYVKLLINNEHSFRSDIIIIRDYVGDDNCPFDIKGDCMDSCCMGSQCTGVNFVALAEEIRGSGFIYHYNENIKIS